MLATLTRLTAFAVWLIFALALACTVHQRLPDAARFSGRLNLLVGTINLDAAGAVAIFVLLVVLGYSVIFRS